MLSREPPPRGLAKFLVAVADWIADLGGVAIDWVSGLGDISIFSFRTFYWLSTHLPKRETILPNFYQIGVMSLPVVALTGTFIGMVLAVQSYAQFRMLGLETRLGAVINMSLVRELGPVLAATMLAGRVGSAMAAELGTMRVTEQIDALRAMGADPIRVLAVPRLLACVLLIPTLVLYTDFMGIMGGYVVSVYIYNVGPAEFWRYAQQTVGYFDIFYGPIKSVFFGAVIGLICCYKGFRCAPGAAGVGRACTESFVASCMVILALDFFLGMFLNTLYDVFVGVRSVL